MSARVYILLDIIEERYIQALQVLRTISGVVMADTLEGHPNILVIIEAPNRAKLAESMMPVLSSVDRITENVHLLVNRETKIPACFFGMSNMDAYRKQAVN